jgi:hypothetical protein
MSAFNVNDRVIGKAKSVLDVPGTITSVTSIGNKRKFTVAWDGRRPTTVAVNSFKKLVLQEAIPRQPAQEMDSDNDSLDSDMDTNQICAVEEERREEVEENSSEEDDGEKK